MSRDDYLYVNKNTIVKIMSKYELDMYKYVEKNGMAPIIFRASRIDLDTYRVTMEKCQYNLREYIDEYDIIDVDEIENCIRKLHNIGVVHGDLHSENIVVNVMKSGKCVYKLIDFSESWYIEDEDQSLIDYFNEFNGIDDPCKNVDHIKAYELIQYAL